MRILIAVALLVACKRDHVEKPVAPPSVYIRRLSPVIGERLTYHVTTDIKLVVGDATNRLEAIEKTDIEANEVIAAVDGGVVRARDITFVSFAHQPLGADTPLADVVTGTTYRWTGAPDPAWSDGERLAIAAYVRRDTGAPDLATFTLTDREFTRGQPYKIPTDEPAPFLRGSHAGASITLDTIEGSRAMFRIAQVAVLDLGKTHKLLQLSGGITMNIGTARIETIALDGHETAGDGAILEAHMTSLQTFTYAR